MSFLVSRTITEDIIPDTNSPDPNEVAVAK